MAYEIRCPIHGSIPFNERERRLIDQRVLQRLRRVSQLGLIDLVFPGATHQRFAHALGAMHLVGKIFEQIRPQLPFSGEDQAYCRQIVRFAALMHDVGHAPFSHSLEKLLPQRGALRPAVPPSWWDEQPSAEDPASHEDYTIALIHWVSQQDARLLSAAEAQDVAACIDKHIRPSPRLAGIGDTKQNPLPLLREMISGEMDADRMDYLLRDAHYAGVSYGSFDQERLIGALSAVESESGLQMSIRQEAVPTYEHFIMARHHMTIQVYFHKTAVAFDECLKRAFREGELEGLAFSGNLEAFLALHEDDIRLALLKAGRREGSWSSYLCERRPPKLLLALQRGSMTRETSQQSMGRYQEKYQSRHLENVESILKDASIEHFSAKRQRTVSALEPESVAPVVAANGKQHGKQHGTRQHGTRQPGESQKERTLYEASALLQHFNHQRHFQAIYLRHEKHLEEAKALIEPEIDLLPRFPAIPGSTEAIRTT